MRYVNEGDSVTGKKLYFEGSKVIIQKMFSKSSSHRGQRGSIYNGECWIEVAIKLPKKKVSN